MFDWLVGRGYGRELKWMVVNDKEIMEHPNWVTKKAVCGLSMIRDLSSSVDREAIVTGQILE